MHDSEQLADLEDEDEF